ncbi:MAG: Gfo/Idh/MocA family oxidoreductase [Elusimicrobia bacterium]|nr:Gfo/Idh/MocA family oxidoreductase [Elusimicrobiota bacterium]
MLPIAVIGVGHLGQHHARLLSQIKNSALLGVVDIDEKRAQKIAKSIQTQAYREIDPILNTIKAAVISVPTPLHYELGKKCLENGIHCLLEKPLCQSVEEAEKLIKIAVQKNLVLQVGHVERFNPAVLAAQKFIQTPKFIEVNRLGTYDPRVSHIGVVLDLMIHDLDIVLSLVQSEVKNLEAFGAKVLTEHEDIVKCRLRFENGCIVDLSASRISLEQYRKIRIFQPDSYISIDYAHKDLKVYRKKTPIVKNFSDIEILKPSLTKEEPLKLELEHFLECIQEGKKPLVSGEHGRDALELGLEILEQLHLHE